MTVNTFIVDKEDTGSGRRYLTVNEAERAKNLQSDGRFGAADHRDVQVYERTNWLDAVQLYEFYLTKLSDKSDVLFQQISSTINSTSCKYWYNGRPQGIHSINLFMPMISKYAKLSKRYTNHCVRATSLGILAEGKAEKKMLITRKTNDSSLDGNMDETSCSDKEQRSTLLSDALRKAEASTSGYTDFSSKYDSEFLQAEQVAVRRIPTERACYVYNSNFLMGNSFRISVLTLQLQGFPSSIIIGYLRDQQEVKCRMNNIISIHY